MLRETIPFLGPIWYEKFYTVNMRSGVTLRHTICYSKALPGVASIK